MFLSNLLQAIKSSEQEKNDELKSVLTQIQPNNFSNTYSNTSLEFKRMFVERLNMDIPKILGQYQITGFAPIDNSLREYVSEGLKENLNAFIDVFIEVVSNNSLQEFEKKFIEKVEEIKISTNFLNSNFFLKQLKSAAENKMKKCKSSFGIFFTEVFVKATQKKNLTAFSSDFFDSLQQQVKNMKDTDRQNLLINYLEEIDSIMLSVFLPAIKNSGFLEEVVFKKGYSSQSSERKDESLKATKEKFNEVNSNSKNFEKFNDKVCLQNVVSRENEFNECSQTVKGNVSVNDEFILPVKIDDSNLLEMNIPSKTSDNINVNITKSSNNLVSEDFRKVSKNISINEDSCWVDKDNTTDYLSCNISKSVHLPIEGETKIDCSNRISDLENLTENETTYDSLSTERTDSETKPSKPKRPKLNETNTKEVVSDEEILSAETKNSLKDVCRKSFIEKFKGFETYKEYSLDYTPFDFQNPFIIPFGNERSVGVSKIESNQFVFSQSDGSSSFVVLTENRLETVETESKQSERKLHFGEKITRLFTGFKTSLRKLKDRRI